jgi:DNA-binding transcriptional MerR regulator
MEKALPAIPAKRYFTIGEVSDLCGVKPYVLRYWEQEFTQLKPMKRRGNRRYYQHHEVLLIRRIRELLYEQGFTISGARNRLSDAQAARGATAVFDAEADEEIELIEVDAALEAGAAHALTLPMQRSESATARLSVAQVRDELLSIRGLLVA